MQRVFIREMMMDGILRAIGRLFVDISRMSIMLSSSSSFFWVVIIRSESVSSVELVCDELLSNSNAASMSGTIFVLAVGEIDVSVVVEESIEFIRRVESSDRGCRVVVVVVGEVAEVAGQQDP